MPDKVRMYSIDAALLERLNMVCEPDPSRPDDPRRTKPRVIRQAVEEIGIPAFAEERAGSPEDVSVPRCQLPVRVRTLTHERMEELHREHGVPVSTVLDYALRRYFSRNKTCREILKRAGLPVDAPPTARDASRERVLAWLRGAGCACEVEEEPALDRIRVAATTSVGSTEHEQEESHLDLEINESGDIVLDDKPIILRKWMAKPIIGLGMLRGLLKVGFTLQDPVSRLERLLEAVFAETDVQIAPDRVGVGFRIDSPLGRSVEVLALAELFRVTVTSPSADLQYRGVSVRQDNLARLEDVLRKMRDWLLGKFPDWKMSKWMRRNAGDVS